MTSRRILIVSPLLLAVALAAPSCALLAGLSDYTARDGGVGGASSTTTSAGGGRPGGDSGVGDCLTQVPEGGLGTWGPELGVVTQMSAGDRHVCAVTAQQDLHCWGGNDLGQLDPKSKAPFSAVAAPLPGLGKVSRVAAGRAHTCAVTAAAEVWCWGDNVESACGDPLSESFHEPTKVDLGKATSVIAGLAFSCAIGERPADPAQRIWCWGQNRRRAVGQHGDDTFATPMAAPLVSAQALATCPNCSTVCALGTDKHVRCWGGADQDAYVTPAEIVGPAPSTGAIVDAEEVAVGTALDGAGEPLTDQVFIRRADGSVVTTQRDAGGVFGPAVLVAESVTRISAGDHLAVIRAGKLQLSPTLNGQLELFDASPAPPLGVTTVSAGSSFDCVPTAKGVSCSGAMEVGQVGTGAAQVTAVPTRVATNIARMSKGPRCTTLLDHDGGYSAFGNCPVHLMSQPWDPLLRPTAVAKVPEHTVLVRTGQAAQPSEDDHDSRAYAIVSGKDYLFEFSAGHSAKAGTLSALAATDVIVGTWWTFVQRSTGKADLFAVADQGEPRGLMKGIDIKAGAVRTVDADGITAAAWAEHACAWKGGSLSCWGRNDEGQVLPSSKPNDREELTPIPLANVRKAVVGVAQTCALTTDNGGEVRCWGRNDYYELGGPTPDFDGNDLALVPLPTGVTDLAGGPDYFCAHVDEEKTIYCWGLGGYGAIGDGLRDNPEAPKPILGPRGGVLEMAAGRGSICARMCDESVWCWGNSPYGEVGTGAGYSSAGWGTVFTTP